MWGRVGAGGRHRLAQASAISVAILAFAVLVLGVALYAYFSSQAVQAAREQGVIDTYSLYASSIYARLETALIEDAPDASGTTLGCYLVTICNRGGSPLRVYLTVLPASNTRQGLKLEPEVLRIPLDYKRVTAGASTPTPRVYVYKVEDVDGDGVSDVVGSRGKLSGKPYFPTCANLYTNATAKKLSLTPELVAPRSVEASIKGPGLDDLLRSVKAGQVDAIPLWGFTINSGGSVTLFIYVEMPVKPDTLALAEFFMLSPKYYFFAASQLPATTSG